MKKKTVAMLLAMTLLLGCAIGGTMAWLTDTEGPIVNTFTVGNINISLTETISALDDNDSSANTNSYKMIPGNKITKDPKVTVLANSEACYLFVKVVENKGSFTGLGDEFQSYLDYDIAAGWTPLSGQTGVYYRTVDATTADAEFAVLLDNKVTVNENITKAMMDALQADRATLPTLTFTAYAVQQANIADVEKAWEKLNP